MHRRQDLTGNKIPKGYQALMSSADGNCLFNSVSILLFGSEERAFQLRMASVLHAVEHFNHYVKMVGLQYLHVALCNHGLQLLSYVIL